MSKPKALPSQDYLNECFIYDEGTGTLTWKTRPIEHFIDNTQYLSFNKRFAGKIAGCKTPDGYLAVRINNQAYRQHRIIYKMINNEEPDIIDHRFGNKTVNTPEEIRNATQQENSRNSKTPKNNTTGYKGVCLNKKMQKLRDVRLLIEWKA
jgi:hypothetical protein